MIDVVLGIFSRGSDVQGAINHLRNSGYSLQDLSIVTQDSLPEESFPDGTNALGGAVVGATLGAVLGGLTGLVLSSGGLGGAPATAFFIQSPVSQVLNLSGATGAVVSGSIIGALSLGLIGTLVSLNGSDEGEATEFQENPEAVLLAVPVDPKDEAEAKEILRDHGAEQIKMLAVKT